MRAVSRPGIFASFAGGQPGERSRGVPDEIEIIGVDQEIVLQAIVERLLLKIERLSPETCYLSIFPVPPIQPTSDIVVTVAPAEGRFDDSLIAGGGSEQELEQSNVLVTIISRVQLDQSARSLSFLTDVSRGVLTLKKQILKALKPEDELFYQGKRILWNQLAPIAAGAPGYDDGRKIGWLALRLAADFSWDLT